jgi:hypothetical protein
MDADDARRLALKAAAGIGAPPDPRRAVAELKRAASLGDARASAELALLAGGKPEVDVEEWLRSPAPHMLSSGPHIAQVEGFLSPQCCDWLIARAGPLLVRAETYDPATGKLRVQEGRSNRAARFDRAHMDVVFAFVRARIAALVGLPLSGFEDTQVLHYSPGETFGAHVDFFDPAEPAYADELARLGQRVMTFLVYLNEGFEGGETAFPLLGRAFKAGRGGALIFSNVTPQGAVDRQSVHIGTPPTRGEKWLLSQWIRFRGA